jgi:hypothetical protein
VLRECKCSINESEIRKTNFKMERERFEVIKCLQLENKDL